MKNANKLLTFALMALMILFSGGLIYVSIYAFTEPVMQPNSSTITFAQTSGIRYNLNDDCFEIFSAAGISWISTGVWINQAGDLLLDGQGEIISSKGTDPLFQVAEQATADSTYVVMNDIVFSRFGIFYKDFDNTLPILNKDGKFDGKGHTLSNFPIRKHSAALTKQPVASPLPESDFKDYYCYSTLFFDNMGEISNLKLKLDSIFQIVSSFEPKSFVGMVSALNGYGLAQPDSGTNSYAYGTIRGVDVFVNACITSAYVGGVAGFSRGALVGCSFDGYLDFSGNRNMSYKLLSGGGIVAYAQNFVYKCVSRGMIIGGGGAGLLVPGEKETLGGVVGKLITYYDEETPGVSPYCMNIAVNGLINYANVVHRRDASTGGIFGLIEGNINGISIYDCVNYGSVLGFWSGGIVGELYKSNDSSDFDGCINFGDITGVSCGGIIGTLENVSLFRSKLLQSYGNITAMAGDWVAPFGAGGIFGSVSVYVRYEIDVVVIAGTIAGSMIGGLFGDVNKCDWEDSRVTYLIDNCVYIDARLEGVD